MTSNRELSLNVRNLEQAALWLELDGQISDGQWENARPYDHYKVWCLATVRVEPANVGRDFYAQKDNYNFSAPDLLKVVGRRMLATARVARALGIDVAGKLQHHLSCEDGMPEDSAHTARALGEAGVTLEAVMRACADQSYGMADMKRDLADLKGIVKTKQAVRQ
jgi:hypothetical protein